MAYPTEFVDAGRGVIHIGSGTVTGSDIVDGAKRSLQAAQDGMPLRYALTDTSAITTFSISADDIRNIARINMDLSRILRIFSVAIIAPSDHAFGMARMWQAHAHATEWETAVFRDAGEARRWLAASVGDGDILAARHDEAVHG
jgi:hypothetical protein